jgi:thiopeptide-type bacteriocin biosynthesis protein
MWAKSGKPGGSKPSSAARAAKSENEALYKPLEAILVRAPLLPIQAYRDPSWTTPRKEWKDAAMAVGSLSLTEALGTERAAAPHLRYNIRMATRPTPYGLFSGVALGRWGDATTLAQAESPPITQTRPDMAWLIRLVTELEKRLDVRRRLAVRANRAAFIRGGRILLSEGSTPAGDGVASPRVSVLATRAARMALRLARKPIPFQDLLAAVSAQAPSVDSERIERLISELIEQSLLITDLRPPLTCSSPAEHVVQRLAAIPDAREIHSRLQQFLRLASAWDVSPAADRAPAYRGLSVAAMDLGAKAGEAPVQVDTAFALSGDSLTREVGDEVARAASLMMRISALPQGATYLRSYESAFASRYGEHREVPLLELLDPVWGLGAPDLNARDPSAGSSERDAALLDLACGALRSRSFSIELDETILSRLEIKQSQGRSLPASLDISAFVCARPGDVDAGKFKIVVGPNIGAPWGGRNIGRFADLLGDPGRRAAQQAATAGMDSSGALMAEIVYLPRTFRLANVAIRPATHTHEFALGLWPGVPPEREIPLDELVVGINKERFYLRWPGHAERVVFCSSHMLNFNGAPAVCHFLAGMDADARTRLLGFDWGPASRFPFLPRVQAGRIVLRPAQWRFDARSAAPQAKSLAAFRELVKRWQDEWQLPQHAYLSHGDVRLLLDLDSEDHAELLRREVSRLKPGMDLLLEEPLPGPEDAWLPGPGGHYMVELVVTLARDGAADGAAPYAVSVESEEGPPRMVAPGGDWLYLKLYCSPDTEDDLLAEMITAFTAKAENAGLSNDFFFVRYSDPDPHIRLRFRTRSPDDSIALLPDLFAIGRSLMERGLCIRFALDTYERETERYGGASAILLAESLFVADSALVLELIQALKKSELTREGLAALTALDLLEGLSLGEGPVSELATQHRPMRQAAGPTYRKFKLAHNPAATPRELERPEILRLLERRRRAAAEMGSQLRRLATEGRVTAPLSSVGASLLHMHCNRFGQDREEESKTLGLMFRILEARRILQKTPAPT